MGLAESDQSHDATSFSPVVHPNAPTWFNRLIDESQFRALRRALALAKVPAGSRALDVDCGTGRWVRRCEEIGFRPTGVDATASMLRLAGCSGTTAPLAAGEASWTDPIVEKICPAQLATHGVFIFQK